jgi:hypothetical protein
MTSELALISTEEDTFCLAVIEHGGNLPAAYRSVFGPDAINPGTKARLLITRPEIAKRIQALTVAVEEHALVSLGSHLIKLAEIRDLAIHTDQLKVALAAEKSRGEVAGFYQGKAGPQATPGSSPTVNVFIGRTPASVDEWAAKHGNAPMVVDV